MVTVNEVRGAVISALDAFFPDLEVWGEGIPQDFKPPCFFVRLFPVSQQRELGRRYRRFHAFDIHFFPGLGEDANRSAHDMAETLYDKLEYIPFGRGRVRGGSMYHEIVDGVLHFFVSYDFHVMRSVADFPKMISLKQEVKIE